jgi:hypothetical protein
MPVKSMLVPLVLFCAVPLTILSVNSSDPAVAPLRKIWLALPFPVGNAMLLLPATAGAVSSV